MALMACAVAMCVLRVPHVCFMLPIMLALAVCVWGGLDAGRVCAVPVWLGVHNAMPG